MSLEIKRIVNEPIDSNCYILFDKDISDSCIIVDPGSEKCDGLEVIIEELALKPEYIILTHEHFDHCWSVNNLKEIYPKINLVCSKICSDTIQNERLNYSHYFCHPSFSISPADIAIESPTFELKWNYKIIHFEEARGHSDSGIIFSVETALFTGDTLIKNVATVTKYKTGSKLELGKTLNRLKLKKGKGYVVYPGHGDIFNLDQNKL